MPSGENTGLWTVPLAVLQITALSVEVEFAKERRRNDALRDAGGAFFHR